MGVDHLYSSKALASITFYSLFMAYETLHALYTTITTPTWSSTLPSPSRSNIGLNTTSLKGDYKVVVPIKEVSRNKFA
jgi:hypothetical protein